MLLLRHVTGTGLTDRQTDGQMDGLTPMHPATSPGVCPTDDTVPSFYNVF